MTSQPGTTRSGYAVLEAGNYQIDCAADETSILATIVDQTEQGGDFRLDVLTG